MSRLRVMVAAFGDAGHAFPAIALARALGDRGAEVIVETWEQWRETVESLGLGFAGAEEYEVFPPPPPDSAAGAAAADAARALVPMMEDWKPDVVVSDILTMAPALAAEVVGAWRATLIPHLYPVHGQGLPFFAFGLMPPRTPIGRALWRAGKPALEAGLRRGRRELNEQRARLGLSPVERMHAGISEELALVATFPQLEYPRSWPAGVHVTGPMEFELPYPDIELPSGAEPLVLVAPSTSQDPKNRLIRIAFEALAEEPVRVVATFNRVYPTEPIQVPDNAMLVEWLSYSQVLPRSSLVICHGGHGTVARALGAGVPVLACPLVGDMSENAARVAWAKVGLALPWRLCRPASLRWAARRVLGDPGFRVRAEEVATWGRANDGARLGVNLVERLAET